MAKKKILMVVNTQIQKDARVLRAAKALNSYDIDLLSMNGDVNYQNDDFVSLIYENHKLKGFFLNVAFWIYSIRFCLKNRNKYTLFYFHDYPIVVAGRIASLLCKKKWVYDAHELLLNHKGVNSYRRNFFLFLEKISIRHANLVVAANDERERIIKFVYKLQNTINVKNIVDLKIELPKSRQPYIVFQGAVVADRDLHPFIDALPLLDKEIHLKIVGGGDCLAHYQNYVKEKSLEARVDFTGGLPYIELMKQSVCAKVGIIVYKMNGLNYIYCEPNKIYEYAQARLPILVSPQPKLKYLVEKYHMGEVLEYPLNVYDVATKIKRIWEDYDSYLVGIEKFVNDYTFENEKQKLCKAVARLID